MNIVNRKHKYELDGYITLAKDLESKKDKLKLHGDKNKHFESHISASENFIAKNKNSYFFTGRLFDKKHYVELLNIEYKNINDVSNVDIIEKGYESYGEAFFEKIKGKFSIVIINRAENNVMLIRDRSGLIPLYFFFNKSSLYFSINLKDLLKNDFKKILNKEKIIEYFSLYNFSKTTTFYKNVSRVEANSIIKFNIDDQISIGTKKLLKNQTFKDNLRNFNDVFMDAIEFDELTESGLILSGGIDSASIACSINANYQKSRLSTYSIDFDSKTFPYYKKSSEKEYQEIVKNEIGSIHKSFDGSKFNPIIESIDFLDEYGQPFYYPNSFILNWICKQAKADNIKVLYSGMGGDTTISWGYESLRERFFKLKFFDFFKELKLLSKNRNISRKSILRHIFFDDLLMIYVDKFKATLLGKKSHPLFQPPILKKEFLDNYSHKFKSFTPPPFNASKYHKYVVNAPDHQNIHELIFSFFNNNDIEHIAPFYNENLISMCLNISPYLKLKNGYERYYFRENMKNIVPEKIRHRQDKANVGISFLINFRNEFIEESKFFINNMHSYLKSIIDLEMLNQYMGALEIQDNEIHKKSKEISVIYMIKIFDIWLKKSENMEY